jgi:Tol biopolymer transport system component
MFWKASDGSGQREEFPRGGYSRFPMSFSPDGKTLAFVENHPSTKSDIWLLPVDGERKAVPFLNTEAAESAAKFSPDGQWLAYSSDETGRNEIYGRALVSAGARKRISSGGGTWPVWNPKGRELFFLKGATLIGVMLDAEMNRIGPERVILEAPKLENLRFQYDNPFYDVMPDGDHFVMLLTPQNPPPAHYNVVVNWFEELKRR